MNLTDLYQTHFPTESAPRLFFAPARVNILGEHIAHTGGLVFSMATACGIKAAVSLRSDETNHFYNAVSKQTAALKFGAQLNGDETSWVIRLHGVFSHLIGFVGEPKGINFCFEDGLSVGWGLDEGEVLSILAISVFEILYEKTLTNEELESVLKTSHEAAHPWKVRREEFLAVRQAVKNEALLLDSFHLRSRPYPLKMEGRHEMVLITSDDLFQTQEAEEQRVERFLMSWKVLRKLQTRYPKIKQLCDLTVDEIGEAADILTEVEKKRLRHFASELQRVKQAVLKLKVGDFYSLGRFMFDSHLSLKNDYNNTSSFSDFAVGTAKGLAGFLGLKMTGLGFGGSLIGLLESEVHLSVLKKFKTKVESESGKKIQVYRLSGDKGFMELQEDNERGTLSEINLE
jgi:galactokinase